MVTFNKNSFKSGATIIVIFTLISMISYFIYKLTYDSAKMQLREIKEYNFPDFPTIRCYDNLFTDKECKQIIDMAYPKLKRSTLGVKNDTGKGRTSHQAWLDRTALPCLERCSNQLAKLVNIPVENQEDWQVLRYEPGQEYTPHFDACSEETKTFKDCIKNEKEIGWGKRVYTFFIYLNDVEEGGETHFPHLNKSFKPKKGTAILWNNLTDDQSKAHPYSKHAGMPVKKGVKWAINVWIRQYPKRN